MGAVKAYTWKELIKQAKIAEKLAKKFEPSVPKNKWGVNTKGHDAAQSFRSKGKETIAVEHQGQINQNRRATPMIIKSSNSRQKCTPSRMSRW